jgi:hypothetical protein
MLRASGIRAAPPSSALSSLEQLPAYRLANSSSVAFRPRMERRSLAGELEDQRNRGKWVLENLLVFVARSAE